MGNGPSIFVRTPQEHLEYMWTHRVPLPTSSPPGHIRIYLLPQWAPGKSPLNEPWAALKADFPLEPTGELELKKVRGKWALERCVAIDLERMQPFEETCKGKMSRLALTVLADEKGVVWMYEPTPSEDTMSMRADRMRIVRQYDGAIEYLLEATLGRISKLFESGVTGESVSHCIYQGSGTDRSMLDVPQETISEKSTVRADTGKADASQGGSTVARQVVFLLSFFFLFMSGALGRYVQFGRELALGW